MRSIGKITGIIFLINLITIADSLAQSKRELVLSYEKHNKISDDKKRELIDMFKQRDNDDYYVIPEIKRRKLRRASKRAYIAPIEVLALVDAQIFGAAKNFLIIGTDGIYFRNDGLANSPGRHFIAFEDLKTKDIRIERDEIAIGELFFDPTGSFAEIDFILKLLKDVQAKL